MGFEAKKSDGVTSYMQAIPEFEDLFLSDTPASTWTNEKVADRLAQKCAEEVQAHFAEDFAGWSVVVTLRRLGFKENAASLPSPISTPAQETQRKELIAKKDTAWTEFRTLEIEIEKLINRGSGKGLGKQ